MDDPDENDRGDNVMDVDGVQNNLQQHNDNIRIISDSDDESRADTDSSNANSEEDIDVDVARPNDPNNVQNNPQGEIVNPDVRFISDSEGESIQDPESPAANFDNQDANEDEEIEDLGNNVGQAFSFIVRGSGLDRPLTTAPAGNMEAYEKFILILAKTLQYKQSYEAMITDFKIANLGFQNGNLPENMRDFWRLVNRREELFSYQVICTSCGFLWNGKVPTVDDCTCGECGPGRKNAKLGTILHINLRSQFEGLLSKPGMAEALLYPYTRIRRNNARGTIEEVFDGRVYKRNSARGQFLHRDNHNYSLTMWVDGVNPVDTANVCIIPVFLQVLELSPRARQRNSILSSVYVGPAKIPMNLYLTPVMEQLQDLYENGVTWRPRANEERTSRFLLLILSCDSEERYNILGMTRHNGHFGCTFCYADGEQVGDGGTKLIYTTQGERDVADRTDAEIREDAEEANLNGVRVRGVKGISALYALPVNLRSVQFLEALHNFWHGCFKRLFGNAVDHQRPHHLVHEQLEEISRRFLSIRTPTKLSRLPRSLKDVAKYTGTEFRNTSWFFWLPCAHEFLNGELNADDYVDDGDDDDGDDDDDDEEARNNVNQLRLFAIFAEATFILNKDSITREELDRAERLLDRYRPLFRKSFPREEWVYNIHLLKHSIRCVRDLGPLWVASGFWFESLNRQVVNYLTSPTDRASQVACRMLLAQMVERCLDMDLRPAVRQQLQEIIGKGLWNERPNAATGSYTQFDGEGNENVITAEETPLLTRAGFNNVADDLQLRRYEKVCIDGVVYQVRKENITRYNNSIAFINRVDYLRDVDFIEIHDLVTWWHGERGLQRGVIGLPFHTLRPAFQTSYMMIVETLEELVYVPLENIVTPGVLVQPVAEGDIYISRLPNKWDND